MRDGVCNAVIESTRLDIEDHDCLCAWLFLDYGGSGQGFGGHILAMSKNFTHHDPEREGAFCGAYLRRILEVAGVTRWDALPGRTLRARIEDGLVVGIGHIVKDDWFYPREIAKKIFPEAKP